MSTVPQSENTTIGRPVKASGAEAYFRQVSDVLQKLPFALIDQLTDPCGMLIVRSGRFTYLATVAARHWLHIVPVTWRKAQL